MTKEQKTGQQSTSRTDVVNIVSTSEQADKTSAHYYFPFAEDPRLLSHPNRDILSRLAGPDNTVTQAEKVIYELQLDSGLTITRLIPNSDQQWRIIPTTGIACRAVSPEAIELLFDPDNQNTIESLTTWSGRQIAHELNHIARMKFFPLHATLLDAFVSEGLGVYYEEHWQGQYAESRWGHVLSKEELKTEWTKAQEELHSSTFDYADWFYGRKNGHKPYAGYSIGNAIVKQFFDAHPGFSILEVTRLSSKNFLEESGFRI